MLSKALKAPAFWAPSFLPLLGALLGEAQDQQIYTEDISSITEYSPRALGEIRGEGFPCFLSGLPTPPRAGLGYSLLSGSPLPSPTKEQHRKLSSDEMYLLDSGGQYWYVFPTLPWPTASAQTSRASEEPPQLSLPGWESSV